LKKAKNILLSNKALIGIISISLVVMGTIQQPFFILLAITYLAAIATAYRLGARIEDYAVNAAYNWSAKWALFIGFLYISGTYMNSAFVYAMFLYILINTTLSPSSFISRNRVNT
jgi:cbb3-type cytochrome oxidase subunit 3